MVCLSTLFFKKVRFLFFVSVFLSLFPLYAFSADFEHFEAFEVDDIRVLGFSRVSPDLVFSLIDVGVGDTFDVYKSEDLIQRLFASGNFDDVLVFRDQNVLVVQVKERPVIRHIEIKGNDSIDSDLLLDVLAKNGIEGNAIYKRFVLSQAVNFLKREYASNGWHNASVESTVKTLSNHEVEVEFIIDEAETTHIVHVNFIGNDSFSDLELLKISGMEVLGFFEEDRYSRQRLLIALEQLKAFYQNEGFVQFLVESVQTSFAPSEEAIYLTINLQEGKRYKVDDIQILGLFQDIAIEDIYAQLLIKKGDNYSAERLALTEEKIKRFLNNKGFAFPKISSLPDIADDGRLILKIWVDLDKRIYVRRIQFEGHLAVDEHVLRRELRQLEGAWISDEKIELSKLRLQRLHYIKGVDVEIVPLSEFDDQVDVIFTIKEQYSSSVSATLGYSGGSGFLLGLNFDERNLLGKGQDLTLALQVSEERKNAQLRYSEPYFTEDGIRLITSLVFSEQDISANAYIARYLTNLKELSAYLVFPVSEHSNFGLGASASDRFLYLNSGTFALEELLDFVGYDPLEEEGDRNIERRYVDFALLLNYGYSSLDRGIFPTKGTAHSARFELTLPFGDLLFYKLHYNFDHYRPLNDDFILRYKSNVGYGGGYGSTDDLPFFEHFFVGGVSSVRGFSYGSLGPQATLRDDPNFNSSVYYGGDFLLTGSVELAFLLPFIDDHRSFRSSVFLDVGNVFDVNCSSVTPSDRCFNFEFERLRASSGLNFSWITPVGPISLVLARPLLSEPDDRTEFLQIELGRLF